MKHRYVFRCSENRGYTKFRILSYAIITLLVFSASTSARAKAPTTAKIVFMSKRTATPKSIA